jgi:hypothetical protein
MRATRNKRESFTGELGDTIQLPSCDPGGLYLSVYRITKKRKTLKNKITHSKHGEI